MRLFTALWPPGEAVEALAGVVPADAADGWRRVDPATWHITLTFHGEAQVEPLARRLSAAAHGASSPRLRLRGAGRFDGVRWAGVQSEPAESLTSLVRMAGGSPGEFVAHVTVLRRRARPGSRVWPDPSLPWAEHAGPWWRPAEVLLVASENAGGGVRYRPVHRVPLAIGEGEVHPVACL